jgi:hypothetical protein
MTRDRKGPAGLVGALTNLYGKLQFVDSDRLDMERE